LACADVRGRGQIRCSDGLLFAHRVVWELTYGPIPEGMCVCHHCDNPSCCNPKHLFLGTQADNIADRDKKGHTAHGEQNGLSKLTKKQVLEIRRRYTIGGITQKSLAGEYDVSQQQVSRVVNHNDWNHI